MRTRWLVIALGLILIGIGGAAFFNFRTSEPLVLHEQTWNFDANQLRELSIKNEYKRTDIKFVRSTDGKDSISIHGEEEQEVIDRLKNTNLKDGALNLDLRNKAQWFSINFSFNFNKKQEIVVSLAEPLESLIVKSDSGSVHLNDALVKNADISGDSGSLNLTNFTGESLSLKSDSGSIHGDTITGATSASSDSGSIKLTGLTGVSNIKSDSGSVRVEKKDMTNNTIKTDSGSVRVMLPGSFPGFYELKSDSGSIHADDPLRETKDYIKVTTDSGSIRIEHP